MTTQQKNELTEIIKYHARKYPLMQPTDAVKLIYQNEFGGGHLIKNKERCRIFLLEEYAAVTQGRAELFESIGNGTVRVFLAALDDNEISPEKLCEVFIKSAERVCGEAASFEEKLSVLKAMCHDGVFSFGNSELDEYIEKCREAGYPAVSHSGVYREAYSPAYRVLREEFLAELQS